MYNSISIVIPAYNEEKTIENVVREAYLVVKDLVQDFEIIVLNDCSIDRTLDILQNINVPNLKIINHTKNLGIEPSVRDLYKEASKNLVFFNGADGDISMNTLAEMYSKLLDTGCDVVVGNRVFKNYTFKRKTVSYLYNFLVKVLLGVRVYDAGTVKLFKNKLYKSISIRSKSVFAEAERLVRAGRVGAKIEKVDIVQNKIEMNDSINVSQIIKSIFELFSLAILIRIETIKKFLNNIFSQNAINQK